MPLAYSLISVFFAASLIKITCCRDISLLVTFMILASGFETISLIELTTRAMKTGDIQIGIILKTMLSYTPLAAIIVLLLCNLYVVTDHVKGLSTAVGKEDS